jgi:glycosyltransferase involved in cell wall biosynthesis
MRTGGNSPRILLIAPQPFYEDRGTPILVLEEIKVLSESRFRVDLVTYPFGVDIKLPEIQVFRATNLLRFRSVPIGFSLRKVLLDILLLFKILRLTYKGHYDCIHGVEEGAGIALVCKGLFGIPVIYDMHSKLPDQLSEIKIFRSGLGQHIALFFQKLLLKYSNAVYTSSGLRPYVLSLVPEKAVWECFISVDAPKRRNEELAHKLGVSERPRVVYTGNFSFYQGIDLLLEAATILCSVIPDVVVILLGGTKLDTPPIVRLIKKHKLEKTVQLHSRVPRSDVAAYLALADVLVLPRRQGANAPLKIYEYMTSGKPIVATDIPAHTALLTKKTSVLVKPEAESFAKGLLSVIQNKELARNIAAEALRVTKSLENKLLRNTLPETYRAIIKK